MGITFAKLYTVSLIFITQLFFRACQFGGLSMGAAGIVYGLNPALLFWDTFFHIFGSTGLLYLFFKLIFILKSVWLQKG